FPVLVDNFSIRPNSGGNGKYSGGNGVIRRIRFREAMTAAIISDHRQVNPFGLQGGQPGQLGKNKVERGNKQVETIDSNAQLSMAPNDSFIIETPGGGGFGA
ncbi:MAG: hydantoinase B/oxoprolinase family protein, partial [Cyanobacteria bacterium J06626_26]